MCKRITIFASLFCFALTNIIGAQEGWNWQNPQPLGNTLQGVSFSDEFTGTAVGKYGSIIRTTDGGVSWDIQQSGTLEFLRDVSFPDVDNGTVVGDHGTILHTSDGGMNWSSQNSGTNETLYGVSFSDADHGTAVGVMGTILRTTDGGEHWTPQSSSVTGTFSALFSVSFTDVNNGTIVGTDGIALHTTDGGENWVTQTSGTTKSLSSVSFYDANNGIAVGSSGTTIVTSDAGANWELMQITENNLTDVCYNNTDNILIVGKSATVVLVTDAMNTFKRFYQVGDKDFYGAAFDVLVGEAGKIMKRSQDGETWDDMITGPLNKLRGISFTDNNTGTVVGHEGTVMRTTNGGETWTPQAYISESSGGSTADYLKDVAFSSQATGYIVSGMSYSDGSIPYYGVIGQILGTINGGMTWNVMYNNDDAAFNGVSSPSPAVCYAVGVYKVLEDNDEYVDHAGWASTVDGGANWRNRYFTNITIPLTAVSFVNDTVGTAVGYEGTILYTLNGGYNWHGDESGTTKNLFGVCFTDMENGTAVGEDGTILRTLDSGLTWQAQSSGTTNDLYSVMFTDAENGIICGKYGTILKTEDMGNTWVLQQSGTDNDLFAVAMMDTNTLAAAGDNGTILYSSTGGVISHIQYHTIVVPEAFSLAQNYPNPFNPNTHIEFTIKESGKYKLNVYNARGQLVSILLDEFLSNGLHRLTFNAGNYASGVYFYQLVGKNEHLTKKMVLIK